MNNAWLALPSVTDTFAWTLAWQSTLWLALGLLAGRILRPYPARAHLALVLAALAAVISPVLTRTSRHLEWGVLPPSNVAAARVGTPMQLLAASAAGDGFVGEQRRQSATTAVTAPATIEPVSSRGTQTSAAAIPARIESWLAARRESLTIALVTVWIACSFALLMRFSCPSGPEGGSCGKRRLKRMPGDSPHSATRSARWRLGPRRCCAFRPPFAAR